MVEEDKDMWQNSVRSFYWALGDSRASHRNGGRSLTVGPYIAASISPPSLELAAPRSDVLRVSSPRTFRVAPSPLA